MSAKRSKIGTIKSRNLVRGVWRYVVSITGGESSDIRASSSDSGVRRVFRKGEKVSLSMKDPGSGHDWIIDGVIPNPNDGERGTEARAGRVPHSSQIVIDAASIGGGSSRFVAQDNGNLEIGSIRGYGVRIKKDSRMGVYKYNIFEGSTSNISASKFFSRPVRRGGASTEREAVPESADIMFHNATKRKGLFEEQSTPLKQNILGKKRNIEMSETRFVSHEFSESYKFSGFEDEVLRIATGKEGAEQLALGQRSLQINRLKQADNSLLLSENELTETIYGNVVDIFGNKLDINYNPITLGAPPIGEDAMIEAKNRSRRGIGFHFQLTTNSTHSETQEYTSDKGFAFSMDKEGAFRMFVPKTSEHGNILYPIKADFSLSSNPNRIETTARNESSEEGVPVTLRDQDGNIVFPIADEKTGEVSSATPGLRASGISYRNSHGYFYNEGGKAIVNINHTKHHNMYAAAELLIANTIQGVLIPTQYTTKYWIGPGGLTTSDPGDSPLYLELSLADSTSFLNVFEIPFPEGTDKTTDFETEEISEFPTYGGTVVVDPDNPAMYAGGSVILAGQQISGEAYSNKFGISDGNVVREPAGAPSPGGKSANIEFEGAIDVSVGNDNYDKKSIVLDAAGSMICWLGEDKNGRSLVMQTDGDVLINVGGSHSGTDPETSKTRGFREGRFDLRVNVTDKGFTTTTYETVTDGDGVTTQLDPDSDGNPLYGSDYVISIGKHGMVIAGMNPSANMIIRNDGNLLLESASGDLTLKGAQVRIVETAQDPVSVSNAGDGGNTSTSQVV